MALVWFQGRIRLEVDKVLFELDQSNDKEQLTHILVKNNTIVITGISLVKEHRNKYLTCGIELQENKNRGGGGFAVIGEFTYKLQQKTEFNQKY